MKRFSTPPVSIAGGSDRESAPGDSGRLAPPTTAFSPRFFVSNFDLTFGTDGPWEELPGVLDMFSSNVTGTSGAFSSLSCSSAFLFPVEANVGTYELVISGFLRLVSLASNFLACHATSRSTATFTLAAMSGFVAAVFITRCLQ